MTLKLDGAFFRAADDESETPALFTAKPGVDPGNVLVMNKDGVVIGAWREQKFKERFVRAKAPGEKAAPTPVGKVDPKTGDIHIEKPLEAKAKDEAK